jgi:hypothetical protein
MKVLVILGAVAAVALLLLLLGKVRSGNGPTLRVRDVPQAIEQLRQKGRNLAFLVFMFEPLAKPAVDGINLQLSIENGLLGLDWVLISQDNVADRARVEAFIRLRGHAVRELEGNGVRYLRVEDGDVSALASAIIRDLYRLGPEATLDTVADGFELVPDSAGSPSAPGPN